MASLSLFVCLLGLVALCHSDCTLKELVVKDLSNPPTGCVDEDGKHHDFGSEWVRDCIDCSCTSEGLSCCNKFDDDDAVNIPEECELVVNKKTCDAKLVLKSDRNKECGPV